ncbi:MAG: hypothetical protein KDA60_18695 [Planctomycetales bacterium]|nr:hypothetical protein [Planctomycetales bacterium]
MPNVTTNRIHQHHLLTGVLGVALTRDAQTAYVACLDGVHQVRVADGAVTSIGQHESYASGIVLREEAAELITAGYDGKLQWHDVRAPRTIRQIDAHDFWSWRLALSQDLRRVATSTGQYLAGSYDYQPADASEPTVKVYDAATGELLRAVTLRPPVQAVALSADGQFVAAGNLMGDLSVWSVDSGERLAEWNTEAFTGWGIIKSHCFIGGIYDLKFSPDGNELYATGMGPMRDPMAGNGKQTWQRFAWRADSPKLVKEFKGGEGLMETLAFHPSGDYFVMGGRLRGGNWNVAVFETESGELVHSLNTKCRVTEAVFSHDGQLLVLAGAQGQPQPKEGKYGHFGRFDVFEFAVTST